MLKIPGTAACTAERKQEAPLSLRGHKTTSVRQTDNLTSPFVTSSNVF